MKQNSKGIIQILPLLLIFAIIIVVIFLLNKNKPVVTTPSPSPSISSTIEPSPSPTVVPTITSSPRPSPTRTSTPAPTQAPVSGPPGSGFSSITVATEKGNFRASVLSVDLSSARMLTDSANDGDCGDNCSVLTLQDFVNKNGGFAGVNGTYFCPESYAECASKKNSFDFPIYNSRLGKWINAEKLFWDNRAMFYVDGGTARYLQDAKSYPGGGSAGIVNYPGLLNGGAVQIDDTQSGLSDKQKAKGTKVGIGVRGDKNVLVVIASNVNMQEFAYVFKSLGASGALNLDTGGSTAMINNGRYVAGPGRNIPNAIIFAR